MPTGYTAAIGQGEETFKEFLMHAARAMGAFVTLRDDGWDKPLPRKLEVSDYHKNKIEEARKHVLELENLSPEEYADLAAVDAQEDKDSRENYVKKQYAQYDRYRKALSDLFVVSHRLPEGFADFLEQQLSESIKFDCSEARIGTKPENFTWGFKNPTSFDPETWYNQKLAAAYKDLAYHSEEYQKELERTEERNKWIAQLWEVLDELP